MRSEETLRNALTPLNDYFDYILLDTAPGYNPLLINILFYANEVLCPVTLETMSIQGLLDFVNRLKAIQEHHSVRLSYVLPTMLDRRYAQTDELLEELATHFDPILCQPIRTDIKLSEAPAFGQTIFEFEPKSKGAQDYEALAKRVLADE
jgi:chromosome partitioning protein